jgi:twitching motility protein PilT
MDEPSVESRPEKCPTVIAKDEPAADIFARTRPHRGCPETDAFLRAVVKMKASDLHLKSGYAPRLRIDGGLRRIDRAAAPTEQFEARVLDFLTAEERQTLLESGSVDLAYDLEDVRFRLNVYCQDSGLSVAARIVPREIPSIEQLRLPPVLARIADAQQGLVLVSGVTGSGKSTTLAAMLEYINNTRHDHILTIEDPIEFLFTEKKCLINQRELHINFKDFPTALRAMVREDPDIVLIGEMRDSATFRAALQAADTGHLVFGTIHASSAAQTISRVLSLFPENEQPSVRQSLVFSLQAIICQKLLKSIKPGVRRVPAVEVLISTPIVRKLIGEARDIDLGEVIQGGDEGMVSFTDSLYSLSQQGLIDEAIGCQAAPNPEVYKMRMRGIKPTQRSIIG